MRCGVIEQLEHLGRRPFTHDRQSKQPYWIDLVPAKTKQTGFETLQ